MHLVLFHRNCADGITAASLLARGNVMVGKLDVMYLPVDYVESDELITFITSLHESFGIESLFMLDFSFDESHYLVLSNAGIKTDLIDHHPRSLGVPSNEPWFTNHSKDNKHGSAARQVLDYLVKNEFLKEEFANMVAPMVNMVSRRDTWVGELTDEHFAFHDCFYDNLLSRLAEQERHTYTGDGVTRKVFFQPAMLSMLIRNQSNYRKFSQMSSADIKTVRDVKAQLVTSHIATNMTKWEFEKQNTNKVKVGFVPGIRALDSMIGAKVLELHPDLDFVVICRTVTSDGRAKTEYSLRSNGYDVSSVCKVLGGGGQYQAAGFTYSSEYSPQETIALGLSRLWLCNEHSIFKTLVEASVL